MAEKPVHSSKHDERRLRKAIKIAEESGNKKGADKIRRIIKDRRKRDEQRYADWKKEQSSPYNRYNANGPN